MDNVISRIAPYNRLFLDGLLVILCTLFARLWTRTLTCIYAIIYIPCVVAYCEYKGGQYQQGQRWDDGCDYNCECMDASTGRYKCTEKYVYISLTHMVVFVSVI
jgi:hypothetical protein